jgi:plasmid stability protein
MVIRQALRGATSSDPLPDRLVRSVAPRSARRAGTSDCVTVILWCTVPNVTVSVPDDVYRAARIRAAEQGSSVSGLVAEYLRSLSRRDAEFARLEAQQQRIQREIDRFSARERIDREELHGRAVR